LKVAVYVPIIRSCCTAVRNSGVVRWKHRPQAECYIVLW